MGATSSYDFYVDVDWKRGIYNVHIGHYDSYKYNNRISSCWNNCSFSYKGKYFDLGKDTNKSREELMDFMSSRLEKLRNGEGEVIAVGQEGFLIYSTEIEEYTRPAPFDRQFYYKRRKFGTAVLIKEEKKNYGYTDYTVISEGSLAELKSKVHSLLREDKYAYKYYIVTKDKLYICKGKYVERKKTTRQTSDKYLVLPLYKFFCYGWYSGE